MKSTDIAMIILIVSISGLAAFGAISAIPGLKMSNKPVSVKTAERYGSDVVDPNSDVFNKNAVNPTVDVTIGGSDSIGQ